MDSAIQRLNNRGLTNKPEADGGAHFTPPRPFSISALFYGYLKLRKKSKKGICGHTWDSLQRKLVSDSLGLVDFSFGLVNSVFNLPDSQVMFFEEFK